jgi:hypothetical protein
VADATSGPFTVTNITLIRTLDLSTASINDLANLIGTLIYDVQETAYDGSLYSLTNGSEDKSYNTDSTTLNEILNVLTTAIAGQSGAVFEPEGYTATGYTRDWEFDCTSTTLNELADVLATLLLFLRTPFTIGSAIMASVQLYQYAVIDIPGETPKKMGSLTEAKTIDLDDAEVFDQTFKVAASGVTKIFDVAENEALGDADFIWMECDLDVWVQFTTSAGASDVYYVEELKGSGTANKMGPARVLGSDNSQLQDGTIDLLDGTADTIDEIWVKNQDSTNAARVRIVVAT